MIYTTICLTCLISFTSLEANVNIAFTGPANIYMDGNFTAKDGPSLTAYGNVPSNLVIYQSGGHTFTAHNTFAFIGVLDAPGSTLALNDSRTWTGSIFCNGITVHDNDDIYLDEKLGGGTGGTISLVK
jgi:hypothetical protein